MARMHVGLSVVALWAGCAGARDARSDAMVAELVRLTPTAAVDDGAALFAGAHELDRTALIRAVLARNPRLEVARQAWRTALAEAPQAGALEDPMLRYALAPFSVVGSAPFGQRVELSQQLSLGGKRRLAADAALAEAEAAGGELASARLELALMASDLFDRAYLVARALEINQHHHALLADAEQSATARYVVGHASAQDPLAAEVALTELDEERLGLERERDEVQLELNLLLHRPTDAPLPPPPATLAILPAPPVSTPVALADAALAARPELRIDRAELAAAGATRELARRAWIPDLELMASYDGMWDLPEHRWMIGVGVNLPLWRRRDAAVDGATARAAAAASALVRDQDEIRTQAAKLAREVREADDVVALDRDRRVPTAQAQVDAALAGFTAGQNGFAAVLDADKNLREAELALETARVELDRRRAGLDRALGQLPGLTDGGER